MEPVPYKVIIFDGACSFCSRWVRLINCWDKRVTFRFATLQSEAGQKLCIEQGLDPQKTDGLVLIGCEKALVGSDAVLAIISELPGGRLLSAALHMAPRAARERSYAFIARNRYRWFGCRANCPVPEGLRERFLE